MRQRQKLRLGDLQLRIMKVLWESGPSTVADVQRRLKGNPLAYTTVATMLRKMEQRRLVRHVEEGRRFIYQAAVGRNDVHRSMAGDLVDRLFDGSLASAVSHLLQGRDVSPEELDQLEQLIRQRRQQQ